MNGVDLQLERSGQFGAVFLVSGAVGNLVDRFYVGGVAWPNPEDFAHGHLHLLGACRSLTNTAAFCCGSVHMCSLVLDEFFLC